MKMNNLKTKISKTQLIVISVIIALGIGLSVLILGSKPAKPAGDGHGHGHGAHSDADHQGKKDDGHKHEHAAGEHHDEEPAKGPHGGTLFAEGDFGLEALLAEDGGEPRLRVWLFNKGAALPANAAKLSATVTRPTGDKQTLSFVTEQGGFKSSEVLAEPHAFEISIVAQTASEPFMFIFKQEEGKVALSDAQIQAAGISLATAGPAVIKSSLQLPGEIHLNEDRTAHVVPRIAAVVESVPVSLGQMVKKGQVLAVLASPVVAEQRSELRNAQSRLQLAKTSYEREKKLWEQKIAAEQDYQQAQQALREAEVALSNAQNKLSALGLTGGGALNQFELRAPFNGLVIEKHISQGEAVKEDAAVFTISDLSSVWAEISVPAKDLPLLRVGEAVSIKATAFAATATGKVAYVGAVVGEQTRMAKARVVLANPQSAWRPGLFVNVELVADEAKVPVAVAAEAIQTLGDQSVIFLRVSGGFIAQPVVLGRNDGKQVEVLQGLAAGAAYAAGGSFVVKSEIGKATAEHTH